MPDLQPLPVRPMRRAPGQLDRRAMQPLYRVLQHRAVDLLQHVATNLDHIVRPDRIVMRNNHSAYWRAIKPYPWIRDK